MRKVKAGATPSWRRQNPRLAMQGRTTRGLLQKMCNTGRLDQSLRAPYTVAPLFQRANRILLWRLRPARLLGAPDVLLLPLLCRRSGSYRSASRCAQGRVAAAACCFHTCVRTFQQHQQRCQEAVPTHPWGKRFDPSSELHVPALASSPVSRLQVSSPPTRPKPVQQHAAPSCCKVALLVRAQRTTSTEIGTADDAFT